MGWEGGLGILYTQQTDTGMERLQMHHDLLKIVSSSTRVRELLDGIRFVPSYFNASQFGGNILKSVSLSHL